MRSVILTLLLLTSCQARVNPPVLPIPPLLNSPTLVFARVGQPSYTWINRDSGGFVAQLQDIQTSPTTFSRYEINEDGLGGTRSDHIILNGWIQPSQEVSITRPTTDDPWTEFAWQVYGGLPQLIPVNLPSNGTITNNGVWDWHNSDGAVKSGTWTFTNTWIWDGEIIKNHSIWTQIDGESTTISDTIQYFSKSGFIGWHDITNNYTSCIQGETCP